ncbi:MAG: HIT domain-containing protein [Deltaproteobacteria bacterium]|nr:HIT domain-containing protein [Deltaproteobacteria bacterium]
MFRLDGRLENDTVMVSSLRLSLVLLMNNSDYPWLVLVPRKEGVREIYELEAHDRAALMDEITAASKVIAGLFKPDKINIGSLGNIVPQLHVHVVGRRQGDKAWPGPVWGGPPGRPYSEDEIASLSEKLKEEFRKHTQSA